MAKNPRQVLQDIRKTLNGAPDAGTLRDIRATLDEPGFLAEMAEFLRGANDPDTKAEILSDLIAISRHCTDKGAERKNQLTNVRYGIGGGTALAASGLIGLAAGAPILLLAVFSGVWIAGIAVRATGTLSEEEQIYTDIGARTAKMREKFDV
ncbi:hypothetical protein NLM33_36130 [Bradyrhizobium sp. CCGUVB1N3]|uniref:hypothetical protein n=1 Tax=Bradyrhizobium sp. CCGUVB1N3 TaxID=2949629 RepID=UPI0020B3AA1E|nr:hypothetical protein [Bradyrhizobium sp. CCGUVB1N3]MCP3475700.1 hypothetical protein [Bradyrhizobium sp. CCGUVB1N3]